MSDPRPPARAGAARPRVLGARPRPRLPVAARRSKLTGGPAAGPSALPPDDRVLPAVALQDCLHLVDGVVDVPQRPVLQVAEVGPGVAQLGPGVAEVFQGRPDPRVVLVLLVVVAVPVDAADVVV